MMINILTYNISMIVKLLSHCTHRYRHILKPCKICVLCYCVFSFLIFIAIITWFITMSVLCLILSQQKGQVSERYGTVYSGYKGIFVILSYLG